MNSTSANLNLPATAADFIRDVQNCCTEINSDCSEWLSIQNRINLFLKIPLVWFFGLVQGNLEKQLRFYVKADSVNVLLLNGALEITRRHSIELELSDAIRINKVLRDTNRLLSEAQKQAQSCLARLDYAGKENTKVRETLSNLVTIQGSLLDKVLALIQEMENSGDDVTMVMKKPSQST